MESVEYSGALWCTVKWSTVAYSGVSGVQWSTVESMEYSRVNGVQSSAVEYSGVQWSTVEYSRVSGVQ